MANGKTDTWYPMYPADYLKDTLDLTLEEDGFYTRALNQVYINKGRIPAEPERLQRLLRVNRVQFNRCKWIFGRYFYQDGDSYGNRRADAEIESARRNLEIARESGKRGNEIRWGKKSPPESGPDKKIIATLSRTPSEPVSPNGRSSSSPSDPPLSPPEFRTVAPTLYAALGIETPSIQEEGRAFEAWEELKAMGTTAEEFAARAARYREKWPDVAFTFRAVLKNWSQFPPPKPKTKVPEVEYLPDSLQPEAAGG